MLEEKSTFLPKHKLLNTSILYIKVGLSPFKEGTLLKT